MPTRRWAGVYLLVTRTASELPRGSRRFSDRVIVLVLLWAAFQHKPISWAVQRSNWPVWTLRLLPVLPSSTTMSRRLRRESIGIFLDRLLANAQGRARMTLVRAIDGTALEIRRHSKDRQAGYGFGSRGKARGYKLHVLLESSGAVVDWRIAPMNVNEKTMAQRMLLRVDEMAYLVADGEYDSNPLHQIVSSKGGQLVAPRRKNVKGLGHIRHAPGRLRAIEMIEGPSRFGRHLLHHRAVIERFFGNADSHSEAMGDLPAWVRTHHRVRRWIHAKLIINAVRIAMLRENA